MIAGMLPRMPIQLAAAVRRVGLVSDIHGNYPALQAVWNDAADVASWICAGDLIGYYTEPNEVCEFAREQGIIAVAGNHDLYVTGRLAYPESREARYRVHWTKSALTEANLDWLRSLPSGLLVPSPPFATGIGEVSVFHATPFDHETYWYPDTPIDQIELDHGEVIVLGHTHHPMRRSVGHGLIVNPGSVGQPRDRTPGAAYAVLDLATGAVEFRRAKYDIERYQRKLAAAGVPEAVTLLLSRV